MRTEHKRRSSFLFELRERVDPAVAQKVARDRSNPKEESPRPEPTRPGPWGD